jgi:hypothetical protein
MAPGLMVTTLPFKILRALNFMLQPPSGIYRRGKQLLIYILPSRTSQSHKITTDNMAKL